MIVAVLGLVVNLVGMRLLAAGKDASLNVKGAYLEVWADMLGSLGVIVAAIVIRLTGWVWVDTAVAVGIALWVLPRTWVLLKESLNILLEGTPEGVDVAEVNQAMRSVDGVEDVHDLHIWALTSGKSALTAHVVHAEGVLPAALIVRLKEVLADRFRVGHTTLQMEQLACEHAVDGCNFVDRRSAAPADEAPQRAQSQAH